MTNCCLLRIPGSKHSFSRSSIHSRRISYQQ